MYPADRVLYNMINYGDRDFSKAAEKNCYGKFGGPELALKSINSSKDEDRVARWDFQLSPINNTTPEIQGKTVVEIFEYFKHESGSTQELLLKQSYLIDGQNSLLIQSKDKNDSGSKGLVTLMLLNPNNDKLMIISGRLGDSLTYPTLDPTLETLLSTFHFLKK